MLEQEAQQAKHHPALSWMARLGFVMYGVVYVVVGVLALQLALGDSEGSASGQGALRELARQPFGEVLLILAAIALAALAVWEVCEAVGGHTERPRGGRQHRHDGLDAVKRRLEGIEASADWTPGERGEGTAS